MWLTHLEFDATNPFMISARVRTVTMTVWARAALDDHRGGETVVRRGALRWPDTRGARDERICTVDGVSHDPASRGADHRERMAGTLLRIDADGGCRCGARE